MNTMQSIFDLPAKKRMLNIVSEKKIYVDLNEDYCPESDKKIKYLNLNENYNPEDDDARFVLWIHFEKIAISEEKVFY